MGCTVVMGVYSGYGVIKWLWGYKVVMGFTMVMGVYSGYGDIQ